MVTLPDTPWQSQTGLHAVVAALGGGEGKTRLVGGCVRDALAGLEAKDVDLATVFEPQVVIRNLEAAGIKAVPTGIAHGTITAVTENGPIEITTLRRDVSTDGRHAVIAYTDDWQEDAARRDFTINALYADPVSGEVFDWFGGIDDLRDGVVRFIGAPLERIAEDHLRILRFFRFNARFGKSVPHPESLDACIARSNDLMALSRERIATELLAILALPNPAPTIDLMIRSGIFVPVLPEINDAKPLARLVAREAEAQIAGDAIRRLASLLPADPARAIEIAARLKLSNAQRKKIASAAERGASDEANPRALAYWITPEFAIDRLLIGSGDAAAIRNWTPPTFGASGGAIVARGVQAGPDVARLLRAAERQWVDEGFPDQARLNAIIDVHVAAFRG